MNYKELEQSIQRMAERASDAARRTFALETLDLMLPAAEAASEREHWAAERELFLAIASGVGNRAPAELRIWLTALSDSMSSDEVRAIEFDGDLVEYMCAVDHWIEYVGTNDPTHIRNLAINRINCIDFLLEENEGGYSTHNMLGAAEMAAEISRIQRSLTPG